MKRTAVLPRCLRSFAAGALLSAMALAGTSSRLAAQAVVTLNTLQGREPLAGIPSPVVSEFGVVEPLATSSSIVGYVKLSLRPGWSLIAYQFFDGHNTAGTALKNLPVGTTVLTAGPEGWTANNLLDGWTDPKLPLRPGAGAFLFNPLADTNTVTFVGEVLAGTTVVELPAGPSLAASVIPQQITPGPEFGLPLEAGDRVFQWVGDQFVGHTFMDDWNGNGPVIAVGEGFIVQRQHAAEWRRTFAPNRDGPPIRRAAEPEVYRITLPALTNDTPQVNLFTWNRDPAFGRVFDVDRVTPLGEGFVAELWGAANPAGELHRLAGPFDFRSGAAAGWLREGALALPQFREASSAWLELRAWYRPWHTTFAEAESEHERAGRSSLFEVPLASAALLKPLAPVNTFPSFSLDSRPRIRAFDGEIVVTLGTDLVLAPTAVASTPVNWQWSFHQFAQPATVVLPNGTNTTLVVRDVTTDSAGTYRLAGTNAFGTANPLSVRVTVRPPRPVAEVLDAPSQTWTTGGAAGWFGQVTDKRSGPGAARSGAIGDLGESWLETVVSGPGLLSFWWKVSSETNWDTLEVQLDHAPRLAISGEVDWERRTLDIPAGLHSVRWRYAKDESLFGGLDHAWFDELAFIPHAIVPSIVRQPESVEVAVKGFATFSAEAKGVPSPTFQWLRNGEPIEGATNATLSFDAVQRSMAGTYAVRISNVAGTALSRPAELAVLAPAPPLNLARAGDALLVFWPADDDFILETAGRLGFNADWHPAASVLNLGGQMALPLTTDGTATFYRLRLR